MAATMKNQKTPPAVDPKFEWTEKEGSYVLCLALPSLRKDDFRVQVDGAGRLTVRSTRPAASTGQGSLHKVFQLPSAASHEDIAGRFVDGVLTLTVPKRAAAPTSNEEIKKKQPGVAKEEITQPPTSKDIVEEKVAAGVAKPKEEITKEQLASKTSMDEEVAKKAQHKEQDKKPSAPVVKREDVKPEATTAPPHKPATKTEVTTGTDQTKVAVAPGSLAERVRRRGDEEGANATRMAAAKRAKTDGEKKVTSACGTWKERMQGELKVLTDMKWADGVVEAARKNKEVVAIGIAAFSLGFLVSHKLFNKK